MTRYLVVLRHGERADYALTDRPQLVKGDPSLTEVGLVQAEIAAQRIISELPNCNSFCILSSPFLRCVETSSKLAKCLGVPIIVEEGFSEIMMPRYFESDILDRVVSKTQPELIENELGVKLQKGKLDFRPNFPETMAESIRRTINVWDSIFPLYSEYECIVVVTHLFIVDELYKYWTNRVQYNDSGYCKLGICELSNSLHIPKIIPYSGYVDDQYSLLNP